MGHLRVSLIEGSLGSNGRWGNEHEKGLRSFEALQKIGHPGGEIAKPLYPKRFPFNWPFSETFFLFGFSYGRRNQAEVLPAPPLANRYLRKKGTEFTV
jgi:hypothetical protein